MTEDNLHELKKLRKQLANIAQTPGAFNAPADSIYISIRKDIPDGLHIDDYPTQKRIIHVANQSLFMRWPNKTMMLNPVALGQIIAILDMIIAEESQPSSWNCIHPRIKAVSMKLYLDGHYANAAEDAFIEVVSSVKELYVLHHKGESVPDGVSLMQKAFTGPHMIELSDQSTQIGKDIQEGYRFLFAGATAAFRNPKAHSNKETTTAQEALRRIMFASSLMYKLDRSIC